MHTFSQILFGPVPQFVSDIGAIYRNRKLDSQYSSYQPMLKYFLSQDLAPTTHPV